MKLQIGKHKITISKADRRDFTLLMCGGALNFFFALEKLFIVVGHQQPDWIWLIVYGLTSLFIWGYAIYDYVHDEIEEEKHETNFML